MTQLTESISEEVMEQVHTASQRLENLWPLTDAQQLDNDVHFGDNLQVRQTFEIAKLLLGVGSAEEQDLTIADAEYVFEGAEDIPGRNQVLVDALLAANDAYEQAHELEDDFSAINIAQIAACLADGESVSLDTNRVEEIIDDYEQFETDNDDAENLAHGFAMGYNIARAVLGSENSFAPALMILIANEYLEVTGSPRTFAAADQLSRVYTQGINNESLEELLIIAAEQWTYRRDEILWDKDEAKRKAKEDDELKSKKALAEKFAHIKDDPNKEEVEL